MIRSLPLPVLNRAQPNVLGSGGARGDTRPTLDEKLVEKGAIPRSPGTKLFGCTLDD